MSPRSGEFLEQARAYTVGDMGILSIGGALHQQPVERLQSVKRNMGIEVMLQMVPHIMGHDEERLPTARDRGAAAPVGVVVLKAPVMFSGTADPCH